MSYPNFAFLKPIHMKNIALFALVTFLIASIQACHDTVETNPSLNIGDLYEGGVIFYIDSTGEHGLICALLDQGFDAEWGCPTLVNFGAKGLEIGAGAQNTIDIINACNSLNIAASLCNDFEYNGYDDWFLPSRDELDSLFQHRDIVQKISLENNGGYLNGGEYWSSSHYLENTVWIQNFSAGNQFSEQKDKINYVRAIRTF